MPSTRLFQLGRLRWRIRICGDGLNHGEALETGMAEVERLVVASVAMGGADRLRFGPGLEILARAPDRMGGKQRVILLRLAAQQVEFEKARHAVEMDVAVQPDLLEGVLLAADDLKAVHGDE